MNHIYKTDDWKLRDSIYKAFNGKCFYTSQKVRKEDMVIDHILPKSKGGEDSVYNYVLTSKEVNSKKGAKLNLDGIEPVLYLVKTIYAPKVLRCIKKIIDRADRDALKVEGKAFAGVRKTIYVPSQEVWDGVKLEAKKRGLSVSQYLLGGKVKPIPVKDVSNEVLDILKHIRDQVDKLCSLPPEVLGVSHSEHLLREKVEHPDAQSQDIQISESHKKVTKAIKEVMKSPEPIKKKPKKDGKETLRQKFRRLNPGDYCINCKNRNRDCVCDD